jgi:hypothetical protein
MAVPLKEEGGTCGRHVLGHRFGGHGHAEHCNVSRVGISSRKACRFLLRDKLASIVVAGGSDLAARAVRNGHGRLLRFNWTADKTICNLVLGSLDQDS